MEMVARDELSERLFAVPQYAQMLVLSQIGDEEGALHVAEAYLGGLTGPGAAKPGDPTMETELFMKRETLPWLMSQARVDEAVSRVDEVAGVAAKEWGFLDDRTLIMRNSQMFWLGKAGLTRRAEGLARGLMEDARLALSPRDPLRCAIRNNAARILEAGDTPEVAGEIYRDLLADFSAWGEDASEQALSTRHNFAEYLYDQGDYTGALEALQYQLLLLTERLGVSSEEALTLRHEAAGMTLSSGQVGEAIEMWEALYEDCQKFLPPDHSLTADVIGCLLAEAVERDNYQDGVLWCDRLIDIYGQASEPLITASLVRIRNQMVEASAG